MSEASDFDKAMRTSDPQTEEHYNALLQLQRGALYDLARFLNLGITTRTVKGDLLAEIIYHYVEKGSLPSNNLESIEQLKVTKPAAFNARRLRDRPGLCRRGTRKRSTRTLHPLK